MANAGAIPVVATASGPIGDAPAGSVPLLVYGLSAGAAGEISSPDGNVSAVAGEDGIFTVTVVSANGSGIFRILDVGGVLSGLLTNQSGNPLDSSWSPAGIVLHADLNARTPVPPTSGSFTLQSVDGATSWVPTT